MLTNLKKKPTKNIPYLYIPYILYLYIAYIPVSWVAKVSHRSTEESREVFISSHNTLYWRTTFAMTQSVTEDFSQRQNPPNP